VEAPAAELQQQAADMTAAAASSPAVLGYYTEQCHPQLRAQTVYVQLADQSAADFKRDAAMQQQVIDNDSLSLSLSHSLWCCLVIANENVPKIIIHYTMNLFFKTAISILVISNHNSFLLLRLLPYILFKKYIYILTLASSGNQHCASCIGTLSFPMADSFGLSGVGSRSTRRQ